MPPSDRCDMHEMVNCADCTGVTARHEESLREPTHWERQRGVRVVRHAQGPIIEAQFHGTCARSGRHYERGALIQYSKDDDGWICLEFVDAKDDE